MWFLLKISVRSRRKVSDVVQNIVGKMAELRFHRLYPYGTNSDLSVFRSTVSVELEGSLHWVKYRSIRQEYDECSFLLFSSFLPVVLISQ